MEPLKVLHMAILLLLGVLLGWTIAPASVSQSVQGPCVVSLPRDERITTSAPLSAQPPIPFAVVEHAKRSPEATPNSSGSSNLTASEVLDEAAPQILEKGGQQARITLLRANSPEEKSRLCFEKIHCTELADPALLSAVEVNLGVFFNFSRSESAPSSSSGNSAARGVLRTAVISGGHMRTYKMCVQSLTDRLLKPNNADLFIVTYPNLAISRLKSSPETEFINLEHVIASHRPYLQQLVLLDDMKVPQFVRNTFPLHSVDFSSHLGKMLVLETGMMMLIGGSDRLLKQHRDKINWLQSIERQIGHIPYDIIVRVRPDIFILGELLFSRRAPNATDSNATLRVEFKCSRDGAIDYRPRDISSSAVFRSPHHPTLLWGEDPFSDHAVFGAAQAVAHFSLMFSVLEQMKDTPAIGQFFFFDCPIRARCREKFHQANTPERIWARFTELQNLTEEHYFGYHALLRDARQFTKDVNMKRAHKNQFLSNTLRIFGIVDSRDVPCPDSSGRLSSMNTRPRKKK